MICEYISPKDSFKVARSAPILIVAACVALIVIQEFNATVENTPIIVKRTANSSMFIGEPGVKPTLNKPDKSISTVYQVFRRSGTKNRKVS